jgi:hypothetical protein
MGVKPGTSKNVDFSAFPGMPGGSEKPEKTEHPDI